MYECFRFADKEKEYVVPLPYGLDLDIVNRVEIRGREFVTVVRCEECVYRRSCMLQHFVESNAVDGKPIDWSEWYCADGVRDISKSDERRKKE